MLNRAIVAASAVVLLSAGAASAALTTDQAKCQNAAAKGGVAYFKKRFTALEKCREAISAGTLPTTTDCTLEPKTQKKLTSAADGLQKKLTKSCSDAVTASLSFGGLCFGVATTADLVTCQTAEHDQAVDALLVTIYKAPGGHVCTAPPSGSTPSNAGLPCTVATAASDCGPTASCVLDQTTARTCHGGTNDGNACTDTAGCPNGACVLGADQQLCDKQLAKALVKLASARQGYIQQCKKQVAKGKLPLSTDCVTSSQTKIDKKVSQAVTAIQTACPSSATATMRFGGACDRQTDPDAVAACSICTVAHQSDDLIGVQHGSSAHGGTAVAAPISNVAQCVGGPLSRCRTGDFLLANDKIRVVIQQPERNMFGIGQFGGQIIDGDVVRTSGPDRDSFEEWAVSLNIENTAHYTSVTVLNDGSNGGPAIIRATGVDDLLDFINPSSVVASFGIDFPANQDDRDLPVDITTDYILEPGTNYVRVETTVHNQGATTLPIFFGEYLNGSGELEMFQSGYGFGEPLVGTRCPLNRPNLCNFTAYMGVGNATGVSYGYIHQEPGSSTFTTSGVHVPQLRVELLYALIGQAWEPFAMLPSGGPGDTVTFTRYFAIGSGNVSDITDARNEIQCLPTGTLSGTVTAGGNPVAGADIAILDPVAANGPAVQSGSLTAGSTIQRNVVTHTRTDSAGHYALTLPPGNYNVEANLEAYPYEGSLAAPAAHAVTIAAFGSQTQDIALPNTGAVHVTVVDENDDPVPAKVTLVGFDPSADPFNNQTIAFGLVKNTTAVFGDRTRDGLPYGIAKVIFIDPSGDSGVVPVEPGNYQAVISRGPEYSVVKSMITVNTGATLPINAKVERVVDTSGFVASDFHVHSIDSPDSRVTHTARVLTMLDEGMDFFTPTDHDFRFDYQPTIDALGATSLIGTAPSEEITSFDYGHFNAWPLTIDPNQVNHGAVDFGGAAPAGFDFPSFGNYNETPATIISIAHGDAPGASNTVQINHIHSFFGLTGGSGLAVDTGVSPPQSMVPAQARRLNPAITNFFSDTFDALEVWIGDDRPQVNTNFLGRNIGDWFNLINQGIVRSGVADSDSHTTIGSVAGFPRTMVASPTDDNAQLSGIADMLSTSVNTGHAYGTNGPNVRVSLTAASTGDTASLEYGEPTMVSTTDGNATVTVQIQSPTWVEFDRIEYYVNTTTTRVIGPATKPGYGPAINPRSYTVTPDFVQTAGTDFTINTVPVPGTTSNRFEATATLPLSGLTEDTWVVVVVKGTDGVSRPLFPVLPNSLKTSTNTTLAQLTDGNLGEDGITALAFTNPLFIDVDGGGWTAPGLKINP
jgi:hypothetical protein